MGKYPRFTMVIIIGRIIAETSFSSKVGIRSSFHWLLGESFKSLAISLINAGGNADKIFGVRGGWNEVALVKD